MFNELCFYLNFITPALPVLLRKLAYAVLPKRQWTYTSPCGGYVGGVDTALGTVCFDGEDGARTFRW